MQVVVNFDKFHELSANVFIPVVRLSKTSGSRLVH